MQQDDLIQDNITVSDAFFFKDEDFEKNKVQALVNEALHDMHDGELYLQYHRTEKLTLEDSRIKSANFDVGKGFGLRAVEDERVGYAHAGECSMQALKRAATTVRSVRQGDSGFGHHGATPSNLTVPNHILYDHDDPIEIAAFADKIAIFEAIDRYARGKDARVIQVSANLVCNWQAVEILRLDGQAIADIRPLIRMDVSIIVEQNGRREQGHYGAGGRASMQAFLDEASWKNMVDEALRQALVNLESIAAPAGEMNVVLGPGWPGILLHEAVGHGLEGDFNRKRTSAFTDMIGQKVAAKGVTVIDDGTIEGRRGSLNFDDEGTPTQSTILIEDGILVNYLQDRQNARLMGVQPTGNGRRESFAHAPMPRMTNTFMANGDHDPQAIIASVKDGIYAVNFGGGQVDIVNGKFVFSCTEAYKIENGKLGAALKGATLIGNGPDALTKVSMVGNDMRLDSGIGTCGKNGQGVPVGVGQPTLRLDGLTVGGTSLAE